MTSCFAVSFEWTCFQMQWLGLAVGHPTLAIYFTPRLHILKKVWNAGGSTSPDHVLTMSASSTSIKYWNLLSKSYICHCNWNTVLNGEVNWDAPTSWSSVQDVYILANTTSNASKDRGGSFPIFVDIDVAMFQLIQSEVKSWVPGLIMSQLSKKSGSLLWLVVWIMG